MTNAKQCKSKGGKVVKGKCIIPKYLFPQPKYTVKKVLLIIFIIFALGIVNILLTNLGTIVHEMGGHVLIAKLMGCKADASTNVYIGTATFHDCPLGRVSDTPCDSAEQCNDNDPSTNDHCEEGVCHYEKKAFNIIVGLASIFVVFFVGFAIWIWFHKDSVIRVFAIIMLFYSCIPSAFPLMPGSDMAYVISQGFPISLAWIIYLAMSGTFLWVLINEVTDTNFFRQWIEK